MAWQCCTAAAELSCCNSLFRFLHPLAVHAISGAVGELCQVATMYPLSTIAVRTMHLLLLICRALSLGDIMARRVAWQVGALMGRPASTERY